MDNFKEILDHIVKNESSKTVGMVCKRIEIALDQAKKEKRDHLTEKEINALKSQIKEVIYEQYRSIRDFIQTGKIIFEFNNNENKSKEK